jgi:hypothetical protein
MILAIIKKCIAWKNSEIQPSSIGIKFWQSILVPLRRCLWRRTIAGASGRSLP